MPTTFDEALDYLIEYGNVHGTKAQLINSWSVATCGELRNAALYARDIEKRPREEIDRMLVLLIWH